jgi:cell division protein FtsQ
MATIQEGRFLRPKKKGLEEGGERFQKALKKIFRITLQLLLLSFFLFVGHQVYTYLLDSPFFRLKEVKIEGCQKLKRETLLPLTRIEGMPNLFTISLRSVAEKLESHPWIDRVRVQKIFPNTILIRIEERKPIAILQLEELYYIDHKGVIFSSVGEKDEFNYPFLTGLTREVLDRDSGESKNLIGKALELLTLSEEGKVSPLEEISEVHMEKTYGIQCFTRAEGVEVRFGWEQFGEKLKRLSMIWADLKKRGISAASIDCSDLKRMVVKRIPVKGVLGRR